jgi:ABC-type transport system substrate-binding protein
MEWHGATGHGATRHGATQHGTSARAKVAACRRLGVPVLALALVVVMAAMAGCGTEQTTTTAAPPTTSSAVSTEGGETFVPTTAVGEATASTSTTAGSSGGDSGGWAPVFEFKGSGTGEKTSELFTLTGAPARLTWDVQTDTMWIIAAFVEPEGHDIKKQGGFPVMMESEEKQGSETLDLEPGKYFVYVNAANCDWTVTIEEQK